MVYTYSIGKYTLSEMFGGIFDTKDVKVDNTTVNRINELTKHKKPFFLFFYMDGCGPCNRMKSIWKKLKQMNPRLSVDNDNRFMMINYIAFNKLNGTGEQPNSFPTIRYIHGKTVESYNGEHNEESMNIWITSKNIKQKLNSNKNNKTIRGGKKNKSIKKQTRTKKQDVSILFRE
jgi:hypothetical protein